MVVPLTKTYSDVGIIGIDLYLSDLVEDVVSYNKYQDSYAFLIDLNGFVIMHPSFPRPTTIQSNIYSIDIRHLEQIVDFQLIYEKMLYQRFGSETVSGVVNGVRKTISYTWHRSSEFYIVCVASYRNVTIKTPLHISHLGIDYYQNSDNVLVIDNLIPELVYHRLDLQPAQTTLCRHFKQIATMGEFNLSFILKKRGRVNDSAG